MAENARKVILVVDDEPDLSTTIARILQWGGYAVTCASSGQQALDFLRSDRFDGVITDVFMPEIDGPQIIAAVRKYQKGARVIAISGGGAYMSSEDALVVARRLGADLSLVKPFTPAQMLAAIKQVVPSA